MEESQGNGTHTDRPSDEEIQVPSGNGDGPPAETDETEAEEPAAEATPEELVAEEPVADEPVAEEPATTMPPMKAPDVPNASGMSGTLPTEESAAEESAAEESAAEAPAVEVVSEPPIADVPAIEIPVAAEEEVAAEAPAAEEPAVVEEAPAEPEPAAEAPLAADIPAAAPGEPSPELAAAVEEALEGVEESEAALEWLPGEWFVVHTYAGYENKVKTNLETRVHSMNMEDKIYEVVIPMEDVMEIKSGKKQVVQRKVFPGYLLVRMDLDDDSWYVVRNTPGVTGFVGSGTKPIPLSEKEVDRILQRKGVEEKPKPKIEYSPGDGVRVVAGPFANFQGVISEIDMDRSKLKVLVNIFGRETPVELGFDQVAKL